MKYLFGLIKTDIKTPLIDLNYHSQYEPKLGIRFNVECIHDNKTHKYFFGTLMSVLPHATYYDPNNHGRPRDAFINTTPNYDSLTGSFKYNEGDEIMVGFVPEKPGLSCLIDIKAYDIDKKAFEDYGFSIVPFIQNENTDGNVDSIEYFVNSGYYSLPVYKGTPPTQLIEELLDSEDTLQTM